MPHARQQRIREWIQKHHNMKIGEISEKLGVSEMTVYRDIQPLLEEGLVKKIYGGIALNRVDPQPPPSVHGCVICGRPIDPRLAYRLVLSGQRVETACCSHCGLLRHRQVQEQVLQAVCQDFFSNTTLSAPMAWYVMGSEPDIRCCQPQVLSFEWKEMAEKFVNGFGGVVLSFVQAAERVEREMKADADCCTRQK
ncbi:transcriptional regulator [Paludifilum halophilum]|uniref:Transcriptional regulator n=1 Tax=Paludifilum halophilum TaxID=1642702 RepID=A0A235B5Q0_9BACL|nr:transcriptional regulator [Paludifilum halophilum]